MNIKVIKINSGEGIYGEQNLGLSMLIGFYNYGP